jgi:hypothetical protein
MIKSYEEVFLVKDQELFAVISALGTLYLFFAIYVES